MSFSGLVETAPGRRLFVRETAGPQHAGNASNTSAAHVEPHTRAASDTSTAQAGRAPSQETSAVPGAPHDRAASHAGAAPPGAPHERAPSQEPSAVLLLHGFTGSTHSMESLVPVFAERFRVLSVDLLGHGRSDAPAEPSAYRMQNCSADLAAVLRARKVKRVHIVGYSLGARVALALALAEPGRTLSLTMISGRAGIRGVAARAQRRAADEALAQRIEREGIAWFVDYWSALPLFASQARLGAEALAELRRRRLQCRPQGLAASLRGVGVGAQPALFDALSCICAPVLLVTGAEDPRFGEASAELAKLLPRAQHVELAQAGHAAHLENPQAFQRAARRFIEAVERSGPGKAHGTGQAGRLSCANANG